jgi:hypothetical protein
MTDNERLEKLQEAVRLLRDVEFSYEPPDHPIRRMMYSVMVECFSLTRIGNLMTELKNRKWKEQGF